MPNILHTMALLLNSRLGSRTRIQSLVEQSRFTHYFLTTPWPEESGWKHNRESGPNWQMDALWGESLLTLRGAYYLSWPILRLQIGIEAKQHAARVIQGHNTTLISLAAADVAQCLRLPFVFETHGLTARESLGGKPAPFNSLKLESKLVKRADKVIVQTISMKRSLIELYHPQEENVLILPNIVDTVHFDPAHWQQAGSQLRAEWGAAMNEIIFLYSGFINWYNGIPELLEAYLGAHFKQPVRLVVCGNGDLANRVRSAGNIGSNRVHYLGTIDQKRMPVVYAACDCLVLARPDVAETRDATPMKLLEAMAMEKMVICTQVEGLTALVDEQCAVLVTPGDVTALRESLEMVANDSKTHAHLGKNARAKVCRQMTIQSAVEHLDRMYQALMD